MRADRLRRWCVQLAVMSALGAVPFGVTSAVVGAVGSTAGATGYQAGQWNDPLLADLLDEGQRTPPPPAAPDPSELPGDFEWG